jgi:hypothetical protein
MTRNPDLLRLEHSFGIHIPDVVDFIDSQMAMDAAQPTMITTANAGIPSFLTNYIDPKLIEVLTAPNKAVKILGGEVKKGDWITLTTTFPIVEHTGEVSTYGDWNNNGSTSANVNFPQRQSYHYQTITQWGERQLEMAGLAKIDWASRLNTASAMVLDKFQTQTYFFGVDGLQNYGLLNDPLLPTPMTPGAKANNTPRWLSGNNITASANEIYADIQSMFAQLATQTKGLIDADTAMVFASSPAIGMALTTTNSFNVNVTDLLKKNFPNIRFETAPQYSTTAGELIQLIATSVEGQETAVCAFTEKMRAHSIVKEMSAFKQKKSQGTWGTIIFRPVCIAQMLGV